MERGRHFVPTKTRRSGRTWDAEDEECGASCDSAENGSGCCTCCALFLRALKNPILLMFFGIFCFIQLTIIVASISSTHNHARRHVSHTNKRQSTRLDWQFRTVIKVVAKPNSVGKSTKSSNLQTTRKTPNRLKINDIISYGSEDFQYPLLVDMLDVVNKVKRGHELTVKPINKFDFPYLITNSDKCTPLKRIDLVVVIKSALGNYLARSVIRETWGREDCWGGRTVRLVFLFGSGGDQKILDRIHDESKLYNDVVQAHFVDHYFNNTYKMMLGFEWATKYCSNSRDILFVDDDYLVQPKAVVAYLEALSEAAHAKLVAGYVWRDAAPVRKKRGSKSKWFVSLSEYPWHTYPAYCSAGAFFVSMTIAQDIVIAMKYTRYLRFDDVFLGLVLHKLLIVPMHLTAVYSYEEVQQNSKSYPSVIASHGYKDPHKLFLSWFKLKSYNFCVA